MTKLHEQIEEMQRRLTQNAMTEQAFVRALGEALSQVDMHLLNEVKRLSSEHETRRGAILHELRGLAERLCLFPAQGQPVAAIEDGHADVNAHLAHANGRPHSPGDWRKATSNIEDDPDPELYWRSPGPSH